MTVQLDLISPAVVQKDSLIVVTIAVVGAPAGKDVFVDLEQSDGAGPRIPPQRKHVGAGPTGTASASFSVQLGAQGTAVLLAIVCGPDRTYMGAQAKAVEVL